MLYHLSAQYKQWSNLYQNDKEIKPSYQLLMCYNLQPVCQFVTYRLKIVTHVYMKLCLPDNTLFLYHYIYIYMYIYIHL